MFWRFHAVHLSGDAGGLVEAPVQDLHSYLHVCVDAADMLSANVPQTKIIEILSLSWRVSLSEGLALSSSSTADMLTCGEGHHCPMLDKTNK